jgi:hypothetical protein
MGFVLPVSLADRISRSAQLHHFQFNRAVRLSSRFAFVEQASIRGTGSSQIGLFGTSWNETDWPSTSRLVRSNPK